MDTRRCAFCHKLQRADAQICSRCGRSFAQTRIRHFVRGSRDSASQPSLPPASSHRVGHYSGLHPEDQPYQSRVIMAYRGDAGSGEQQRNVLADPEEIMFPETGEAQALKVQREQTFMQTLHTVRDPASRPPLLPWVRKPGKPRRVLSVILTLVCILFLLASSLIAFVYITSRSASTTASVKATPDVLRVGDSFTFTGRGFTPRSPIRLYRDQQQALADEAGQPLGIRSDTRGNFSVLIRVAEDWSVGPHTLVSVDEVQKMQAETQITIQASSDAPPLLQLSQEDCVFTGAASGVISSQYVILHNAGGDEVSWQASTDRPWLKITPRSGLFAGSQRVQIAVNRAGLKPGSYTGDVSFTWQEKTAALKLHVRMEVTNNESVLSLSTTDLAYATTVGKSPDDQTLTLRNDGKQDLSWSTLVGHSEAYPWLLLSPDQGTIAPGQSQLVKVQIQAQKLAVGNYQSVIQFNGGASAQVAVALTVSALSQLVLSPPSLDVAVTSDLSSAQVLDLQNNGEASSSWSVQASTSSGGAWLGVTPASGLLLAGKHETLNVVANAANLSPGTYQGLLIVTAAEWTSRVPISLTVSAPAKISLSAQPSALDFVVTAGTNPTAKTLTVTNTGNVPLPWSALASNTALTVTPAQGTLPVGQSAALTVTPVMTNVNTGVTSAAITLSAGNGAASQTVAVRIELRSSVKLTTSDNSLLFVADNTDPTTFQQLFLRNDGTDPIRWQMALAPSQAAPWLSYNYASGQLSANQSSVLQITCDSTKMSPGTYQVALWITESSSGALIKAVPVTLVVQ